MAYVARKISKAKWIPKRDLKEDEISSDAVTRDFQTSNNQLSLWDCSDATESELREVALALAATRDRPDPMEIVWIEKELMEKDGISLESSLGKIPVNDLQGRHLDAVSLDLVRIGKIAKHVADAVRNRNQWYKFTKNDILEFLMDAVKRNRMDIKDLKPDLQEKVKARL